MGFYSPYSDFILIRLMVTIGRELYNVKSFSLTDIII